MSSEQYDRGDALRREIAGNDVIDALWRGADAFTTPMQHLVTEYCWGAVWSREDLDRRSRSILNLGMLLALNRPDELRAHLRMALTNGVTAVEIRECLLQAAIYAGVPAANAGFTLAREVLTEAGALPIDRVTSEVG